MTLVELLVVLLLLAVMAGVSGLALSALRTSGTSRWDPIVSRARREAIVSGRAVSARDTTDSIRTDHAALFLPDGRAIGSGVDPLTGEVMRETR